LLIFAALIAFLISFFENTTGSFSGLFARVTLLSHGSSIPSTSLYKKRIALRKEIWGQGLISD